MDTIFTISALLIKPVSALFLSFVLLGLSTSIKVKIKMLYIEFLVS